MVAGFPDIFIGETITDRREGRTAPRDLDRRADHHPQLPRQQLALCRPRRQVRHLAPDPRPARERARDQRRPQGRLLIGRLGLQGLRPRRAAHRDPPREHAPRRLRDAGLAAAGHLPRRRRQEARTVRRGHHRHAGRLPGRDHRAPRHAQIRHEGPQGARKPSAPDLRRTDARIARLSQPIRPRHQGRGHPVLALRRLPAVRRRDQAARRSAR